MLSVGQRQLFDTFGHLVLRRVFSHEEAATLEQEAELPLDVVLARKSVAPALARTMVLPISPARETEQASRPLQDLLPPYSVVLHNDELHSMDYVVASLVKSVPSLSTQDAAVIMLEAHSEGRAVVITCPLERAELYRDRIRTFGLTATIEKT